MGKKEGDTCSSSWDGMFSCKVLVVVVEVVFVVVEAVVMVVVVVVVVVRHLVPPASDVTHSILSVFVQGGAREKGAQHDRRPSASASSIFSPIPSPPPPLSPLAVASPSYCQGFSWG